MGFREDHSLEKRRGECKRIREKYPNRIPIIVEKHESSDVPVIDKKKFLVPEDVTFGQFLYIIRNRMNLPADKAMFLFIQGSFIPPVSANIQSSYEEFKDEDGFLYCTYAGENTFGSCY